MNWETTPTRYRKEREAYNFRQTLRILSLPILALIGLILTT